MPAVVCDVVPSQHSRALHAPLIRGLGALQPTTISSDYNAATQPLPTQATYTPAYAQNNQTPAMQGVSQNNVAGQVAGTPATPAGQAGNALGAVLQAGNSLMQAGQATQAAQAVAQGGSGNTLGGVLSTLQAAQATPQLL